MASNEEARSVTEQNDTRKAEAGEQRDNPTTPEDQNNTQGSKDAPSKEKSIYANFLRVSKDNLYMIIALWMEDFVDEAPEHHRKVGAVLVLPNDVVLAADCSQDGAHAVARLLMKHHNKAEGCKMFMSRKPCPFCAKLLVQSKVKRVLYLPLEPEYYRSPNDESVQSNNDRIVQYNDEHMKQVDNLFTASAIAQTKFVLQVEEPVLKREKKDSPTHEEIKAEEYKNELIDIYGFNETSEWMKAVKKELPWPVFDEMKTQVQEYFDKVMDWIATVLVRSGGGLDYEFESCNEKLKNSEGFNPVNDPTHAKKARHFIAIARFLARRTDDPETGVGAVIVSPMMEILALGWNGFPLKAQYGEFARASKVRPTDDQPEEQPDKKYPYVIHAEQNAILMRNNKNIEGAILFVTKSPCNECAPLIAMQGIKTVVVDADLKQEKPEWYELGHTLGYNLFFEMVKDGNIICYKTKKNVDAKNISVSENIPTKINF